MTSTNGSIRPNTLLYVAAIAMSAFCDPHRAPEAWNHLVRFAFCKRDETLDEAIRRLRELSS